MEELEKLKPLALLLLRLGLGIIFVYHGYPKLFTHTHETMQGMAHMGFPAYFAYIAGVFEMAVALVKVHGIVSNPMAVENYQFPLALTVGAFALAALGAGLLSLDHAIFASRGGPGPRKSKNKNRDRD
jgi:putative oxidoreductase